MNSPILVVENIVKEYGGKAVLKGISFSLGKSVVYSLLGPNSAGKTTLLNVLCGMVKPETGSVIVNDMLDLAKLPDNMLAVLRRNQYSYLLQEDIMVEHFNTYDNIVLPFILYGKQPPKDLVDELVKIFNIEKLLDKYPSELSGGERRKVSLIRALVKAHYSSVVLLDEPTSNLDIESTKKLIDILPKLSENRIVVIATHDQELAKLPARIVAMRSGQIERIH